MGKDKDLASRLFLHKVLIKDFLFYLYGGGCYDGFGKNKKKIKTL